jgi:hypothetical protein
MSVLSDQLTAAALDAASDLIDGGMSDEDAQAHIAGVLDAIDFSVLIPGPVGIVLEIADDHAVELITAIGDVFSNPERMRDRADRKEAKGKTNAAARIRDHADRVEARRNA